MTGVVPSAVSSTAGPGAAARAGAPFFGYGTLRFPDVVQGLLGRAAPAEPAIAPGWRAAPLLGRVYPGLVPAPADSHAHGLALTGLTEPEWLVLDAFEGDPYELREIRLGDGRLALTYVWRDMSQVCDGVWEPERFAAQHLGSYAHRARAWRGRGAR